MHREVLEAFMDNARQIGFSLKNLTFSPVKGPEGNIEFLAHLTKRQEESLNPDAAELVRLAHQTLNGGKEKAE